MKKRLIAILSVTCILLTGCTKENNNKEYIEDQTYTVISIDEFLDMENIDIELANQEKEKPLEVSKTEITNEATKVFTLEKH